MDRKTYFIGVLIITAAILIAANILAPTPIIASESVQNRDYAAVTAPNQRGGEALYILDNRTGIMAVYSYDVSAKTMVLRGARPLEDAFAGMPRK